jgi:hypothetical protein
MPDLGQKDSDAIRYEDQEVRRSNTELTGEGPAQGDPIHWMPTWYLAGGGSGVVTGVGSGDIILFQ